MSLLHDLVVAFLKVIVIPVFFIAVIFYIILLYCRNPLCLFAAASIAALILSIYFVFVEGE